MALALTMGANAAALERGYGYEKKTVEYRPRLEMKPSYYKEESYAPKRKVEKKYVGYQQVKEAKPMYYEDKQYAKPRPVEKKLVHY